MYSLEQSLNLICWYNGHTKTFLNLAEELKSYNKKKNFYWKHKCDTEEHFIRTHKSDLEKNNSVE